MARGFTQIRGRDFDETYAPTVGMSTIRTVLALAAQESMTSRQLIKTAYLNADVEEHIYLQQPIEFVKRGPNGEEMVCQLNKSLCGLKQAGRNWHLELKRYIIGQGFDSSKHDNCLFTRKRAQHKHFSLVWVDDIILQFDSSFGESFVEVLKEKYKISEFSKLNWFLGMNIKVDSISIRVNQRKYISTVLEE